MSSVTKQQSPSPYKPKNKKYSKHKKNNIPYNKNQIYSPQSHNFSNNDEDEYSNLSYNKTSYQNNKESKKSKNKKNPKKFSDETSSNFKKKWKTEICHFWELNGYCQYGDKCAFAHGNNDIRNRKISANYKTKPCKQFFENGFCPYGTRCQFSHKEEKKASSPVSYTNIISNFLKSEKIDETVLKRPRLMTFEIITQTEDIKEKRIKLFEDILEANKETKLLSEDETNNSFNLSNSSNNNCKNIQRNRFMSI